MKLILIFIFISIFFYGPLKKRHIGNLGVFFCDFAPFLFSIENKSAFRADPNVSIPGSYTAVVRKLRENFCFGKFSFLPKIRGPENGILRHSLKIAVIFFA